MYVTNQCYSNELKQQQKPVGEKAAAGPRAAPQDLLCSSSGTLGPPGLVGSATGLCAGTRACGAKDKYGKRSEMAAAGERWRGWKGVTALKKLSPPGASGEPPGRCAGAHRALLVPAAKAGADLSGTPRVWGLRGSEKQASRSAPRRVASEVAPPPLRRAPSALCHPTQPSRAEGRVGPPRCARGWAESGRCAAPPRPAPGRSPRPLPRVKVKVSVLRRSRGGRGRRGPGSGRRAPEGPWMGSAAASEPA